VTREQMAGERWYSICAGITILSAVVSAGFSIAAVVESTRNDVLGWYALSRSAALLLAAIVAISRKQKSGLAVIAVAMGLVQLFDAVIGFHAHIPAKTYGPLAFALITFFAVSQMSHSEPTLTSESI
jgi:hypothetical protein